MWESSQIHVSMFWLWPWRNVTVWPDTTKQPRVVSHLPESCLLPFWTDTSHSQVIQWCLLNSNGYFASIPFESISLEFCSFLNCAGLFALQVLADCVFFVLISIVWVLDESRFKQHADACTQPHSSEFWFLYRLKPLWTAPFTDFHGPES